MQKSYKVKYDIRTRLTISTNQFQSTTKFPIILPKRYLSRYYDQIKTQDNATKSRKYHLSADNGSVMARAATNRRTLQTVRVTQTVN